jgi:hypothetical protein
VRAHLDLGVAHGKIAGGFADVRAEEFVDGGEHVVPAG